MTATVHSDLTLNANMKKKNTPHCSVIVQMMCLTGAEHL